LPKIPPAKRQNASTEKSEHGRLATLTQFGVPLEEIAVFEKYVLW
jgi:hypothetical protein